MVGNGDAGVIDQHIDAAMARDYRVMHALHRFGVGHVQQFAFDAVALGRQLFHRAGQQLGIHVGNDDGGAGFGQRFHGGQANAARGARDDGDLVGQFEFIEVHPLVSMII